MLKTLHESEETKRIRDREIKEEARGSSQIGPFDYCPRLGFRRSFPVGVLGYQALWSAARLLV